MSNIAPTDAPVTEPGDAAEPSGAPVQYRVGDPAPPPLKPFTEPELIAMWGGKTEPVVSILCPTYNHREFIADALDGFLGQATDFPFEVIVRDDASTDGTADIVRSYAERYPKVVRAILEPQNTFSRGISFIPPLAKAARGSLIATCAGDDYWIHPGKLAKQAGALRSSRTAAAVHHEACSVNSGAVEACPINLPVARRDISSGELARGVMAMPLTLCFRKDSADLTAQEFNMIVNEDNLIFTQLSRRGNSIYLPEVMSAYRTHGSGMWSSASSQCKREQTTNSFLWISRYHFRTGSPSIGRRYALWAGLKKYHQLAGCGSRVAGWALVAMVGKWAKTLIVGQSSRTR